jgi:hypothetical protein
MKYLLFLLLFGCATIPEPKNGETFYLESLKNCDEILSAMRCELVKIDTLKYDKRVVYLIHYKRDEFTDYE